MFCMIYKYCKRIYILEQAEFFCSAVFFISFLISFLNKLRRGLNNLRNFFKINLKFLPNQIESQLNLIVFWRSLIRERANGK